MDSISGDLLQSKKELNQMVSQSQNILQLSQKLTQTTGGPRLNPNQIESKSGDNGDLFESGNLFQNSQSNQLTQSGSILNQYCQHVFLTQDVEQSLFQQIKMPSTFKINNICKKKNCQMKFNPGYTNLQKVLLYQLHENQINELKNKIQQKNSKQIKICDGQGCEFYFIFDNQQPQSRYYYCPLCLDNFEFK